MTEDIEDISLNVVSEAPEPRHAGKVCTIYNVSKVSLYDGVTSFHNMFARSY